MVSPSPTVSMLSSILWSLCSFLLRLSRFWEVRSSGAGFTTFPLHSTFEYSDTRAVFIVLLFQNRNWFSELHSHCRLQWRRLFARAAETSRSICHSCVYQRQWTQSHTFQPLHLLWGHLMKTEIKHSIQKRKPLQNYKIYKSTYSEFSLLFHAVHQSYFQLQPTEKKAKLNCKLYKKKSFLIECVKSVEHQWILLLSFASLWDTVSWADTFKLSSLQDFRQKSDSSKMYRKLLAAQMTSETGYTQSLEEKRLIVMSVQ